MDNKKINKATALALMEIMDVKDVAKMIDLSLSQLYRLKSSECSFVILPSDLDKELIAALGLKICECCGVRVVPVKPVRYQILTRLCEPCWSGDFGEEDYNVRL